jgi:hypothetical protein
MKPEYRNYIVGSGRTPGEALLAKGDWTGDLTEISFSEKGLELADDTFFTSLMIMSPRNEARRTRGGDARVPSILRWSPGASCTFFKDDARAGIWDIPHDKGDCPDDIWAAFKTRDVSAKANPGVQWLRSKWLLLVVEGAPADGREDFDEVLLIDVVRLHRHPDLTRSMPPFCYATASRRHDETGELREYRYNSMNAEWRAVVVHRLRSFGVAARVFPDAYSVFRLKQQVRDMVVWTLPR